MVKATSSMKSNSPSQIEAVQKGEPMNCHICGRDTDDGPVCECADDIQRYREALTAISEMTDAEAEFNAAETAREALNP